jgi:hypothetical protein
MLLKRQSFPIMTPETAVGRELVLRLASLLWRLRRANAIEADLFELHAEALGSISSRLVEPNGTPKLSSTLPSNPLQ